MTITKSKQILISEGTKLFYTGLWPQLQCTVTVMRGRICGEIKLGSGYITIKFIYIFSMKEVASVKIKEILPKFVR